MARQRAAASEPTSPDSSCCTTADASPACSPGGPRQFTLRINLATCKYPVLRVVQRQLGWAEVDDEDAHVHWCDTSAGTERLVRLSRPQRLNHFPGMLEIARKKALARNLAAMRCMFPEEYSFSPRTFLLPEMMEAFEAELLANTGHSGHGGNHSVDSGGAADAARGGGQAGAGGRRQTFILKLDNGSMGRGIKLVQTYAQAMAALPTFDHENVVASEYVDRPFLIDGKKFDLRIYVLVRCCNPLRIFLCREGLVRFCTEPYQRPAPGNLHNAYAHLTNYAVNKLNPSFVFNQDAEASGTGSKWTITAFARWMRERGHDFDALWRQVAHIVVKTVVAAQPMLQYQYECATKADDDGLMCFELLGFDVLVDEDLRPWLLEVNHSPSLTTDTPLDLEIKARLIREVLALAGVQPDRVRAELAAKERAKQARLYSGHAACVTHAAAAAAAVAAATVAPGGGGGGGSPGKAAGLEEACESGAAAGPGTGDAAEPAAAPAAATDGGTAGACSPGPGQRSGAVSPGPGARSSAAPTVSPGAGCALLGPAVEPARGSSEWEAAQQAYEDVHLGQFDRIMPPDDPELAALYERLLGGALQVFYRTTMQGRNQLKLVQIKERRLQEEAEAAARQEALQRRAEGLRAWMAAVCQRHREERQLRAAAAAAEAASGDVLCDQDQLAGVDSGSGGGSSDGGGASLAGSQGGTPDVGADLEAAKLLRTHFTVARLALPSSHGQPPSKQQQHGTPSKWGGGPGTKLRDRAAQQAERASGKGSPGPGLSVAGMQLGAATGAHQCFDSARASTTSGYGAAQPAQQLRRPGSAGPQKLGRAESLTLEEVIEQRLAASAVAGDGSTLPGDASPPLGDPLLSMLPPRPGSAALAAWAAAVTKQQGQITGCEAGRPAPQVSQQQGGANAWLQPQVQPLQPQAWQQQAWDSFGRPRGPVLQQGPAASSTFLDRVATFTAQQQRQQHGAESEVAALCLQSSSSSGGDVAGAGAGSRGSLEGSGSDPDFAARSADGSVLSRSVVPGGSANAKRAPTPDLGAMPAPLDATYIPPTLLSALHTVRMSPRLLSGLKGYGPAGAGAAQQAQQEREPWRGSGMPKHRAQAGAAAAGRGAAPGGAVVSGCSASSAALRAGVGLAPLEPSWGQGAGSPSAAAQLLPAKGTGSPAAGPPPAAKAGPQTRSPGGVVGASRRATRAGASPKAAPLQPPSLAGVPPLPGCASSRDLFGGAAGQWSGRSSLSGASAGRASGSGASQQQYKAAIEQQAVQSVAALISGMINERGL